MSLRYLLAFAALEDWEIEAMDVKLAFLHGMLKEEIYMEQPEGFVKKGEEKKVCRLIRSIYGLKQASRVWYETFAKFLNEKMSFQVIHSDAGVYVLRRQEGNIDIVIILYVDDILIMGNDKPLIIKIKKSLSSQEFKMKDLGPAESYLGMRITRDRKRRLIWLDQVSYVTNALNRFQLSNANSTRTPLPSNVHLEAFTGTSTDEARTEYQQMIGTLLYAALGTRPDIAYAVTRLSRYMANPSKDHLHYAKYVFKYLVGTKELRLKYDGLSQAGLIGFSDSDWGENKDDRHSTSGNVFMMANCAITWMCRRQKVVATSVGEAEYMELSDTAKQCAWLRSFAHEINFSPTKGTPLCADNQAAIFIATNKAID